MKTIYKNAVIYTAADVQSQVEAMIVEDGQIIWVGQEADIPPVDGKVINLEGKTVIPGLIEAHIHPIMLAQLLKQVVCLPPVIHSIEELIEVMKQYDPSAKGCYEGWGYDEGKLAEKRSIVRSDLDRVSTELPVVVMRTCAHIISVNSKALEIAGITKDTPNPPGGEIDRDETGEPTGILRENARNLVLKHIKPDTEQEIIEKLVKLSNTLSSYGITTITEMMATEEPFDYLTIYQHAQQKGFKQRVANYYHFESIQRKNPLNLVSTNTANDTYIAGIKLFADGSISGKTALVHEPFLKSNQTGIDMTSPEEILAAARKAEEHGVQLAIHAMGDKAIEQIVNTCSQLTPWLTDGPSVRIEHATMISDEVLKKAVDWGIGLVPQPIFLFCEIESYLSNLGLKKSQTLYGLRSFLDAGAATAITSDAPATSWAEAVNPFISMQVAVTRKAYDGTDLGQSERITTAEALQLYTKHAQTLTRTDCIGQLREGYAADFVILEEDLMNIPADQLMHIKPLATYIKGEKVFERIQAATGVGNEI